MSQIVAYLEKSRGIVVASDSRVVYEDDYRGERLAAVRKLYPVGRNFFIASVGEGFGVEVSIRISRLFHGLSGISLNDFFEFSFDYINSSYKRFIEMAKEWYEKHPNAYKFLYVIVGGRCPVEGVFDFKLFACEYHQLPMRDVPHQGLVCFPRRFGLEMGLVGMRGKPLESIASYVLDKLKKIEEADDRISSPFHVGIVDERGFRYFEQ